MSEMYFMPMGINAFVKLLNKNESRKEITYPQAGDIAWYHEEFCYAKVVEAGQYMSGIMREYDEFPIYVYNEDLSIKKPISDGCWRYVLVFNAKPPKGFVYKLSKNGFRIFMIDDSCNPPIYAILSETSFNDNVEFQKAVEKVMY